MSEQERLKAENEQLWSMLTELHKVVLIKARDLQQIHSTYATVIEQMKGRSDAAGRA